MDSTDLSAAHSGRCNSVFVFEDTTVLDVRASPGVLTDKYRILGKTLGRGRFAKVKLGENIETGEKVAIKILEKPTGTHRDQQVASIRAEVDILLTCDHPNVVKMYACYETSKYIILVLELLSGGELFDSIIRKGFYTEQDARSLSRTLLDALQYLHSRGVCHRDLKPENLLLKDCTSTAAIKIGDFGLSRLLADDERLADDVMAEPHTQCSDLVCVKSAQRKHKPSTDVELRTVCACARAVGGCVLQVMKTPCGTAGYVAPEVLSRAPLYSTQVDLWSVGVITYILLCGFPPFFGDNDLVVFQQIQAGAYRFLEPWWDPISAHAKDFVSRLLVVDPKKRMTAAEALHHLWIRPDADSNDPNAEPVAEPVAEPHAPVVASPHSRTPPIDSVSSQVRRAVTKRYPHRSRSSSLDGSSPPTATAAGLNARLPPSSLRSPLALVSSPGSRAQRPRVTFAPGSWGTNAFPAGLSARASPQLSAEL